MNNQTNTDTLANIPNAPLILPCNISFGFPAFGDKLIFGHDIQVNVAVSGELPVA